MCDGRICEFCESVWCCCECYEGDPDYYWDDDNLRYRQGGCPEVASADPMSVDTGSDTV